MSHLRVQHPNDRPNFTRIDVGPVRFWVSYETIVAFHAPGEGTVVSENVWSQTTGKHLNLIDSDHSSRLAHEDFEGRLAHVLERIIFEPRPSLDEIREEFIKEAQDA